MISICDFNDSFTYNLFSDFCDDYPVQIIDFKKVKTFLETKINTDRKEIIILGPGPGHPREYAFLSKTILKLIKNKNILLFGVCLGHQLIWEALGFECTHSKKPTHGQREELFLQSEYMIKKIHQKQVFVQRYNSLAISLESNQVTKLLASGWLLELKDNELYIAKKDNILTYQFHPESIGTSCPNGFYSPIKEFLLS